MSRIPTICAAVVVLATVAAAESSQSSSVAKELARQLSAKQMDAIATVDPQAPDRFLAAMFVAPSQLLVVGARHANPAALTAAIRDHRYRDVYLDLQTAPKIEDKIFVHDLGADGLAADGDSVADNAYKDGVRAELVKSGKTTGQFTTMDAEYARMLRALVTALNAPAPAPATTSATS